MQYIASIAPGYIIAILSLIVFYKKLNPAWLRLFLWFVSFEFATQWMAIISLETFGTSNIVANMHTIVAHVFYLYIFYLANQEAWLRKLSLISITVFLLTAAFEMFYFRSINAYANITDVTGRICILISSLLYLKQLLVKDEVVNYFTIPMFWITTGIMACIAGDWMYVLFYHYLIGNAIDSNGEINYVMLIITNNIQYLLFTIGFVCNQSWKKVRQYPSL